MKIYSWVYIVGLVFILIWTVAIAISVGPISGGGTTEEKDGVQRLFAYLKSPIRFRFGMLAVVLGFLVSFVAVLVPQCSKEVWLGIVYPDKNNLTNHKIVGEYLNLNSCLKEVNSRSGSLGSYECAKNCDRSTVPMICEETVGNER